jgi:hypothetical protein
MAPADGMVYHRITTKDDPRMPKRLPAISDEVLRREAHMLTDDARLLPTQVIILTGLSDGQLKERRRLTPPKAPLPEPREGGHAGVWYSMGTIRAYLAAQRERAEIDVELHRRDRIERELRFSAWLGTPNRNTMWPFALVGPHKRPVDVWATIRGEIAMGRGDKIQPMSMQEYLEAHQAALAAEVRAADHAEALGTSEKRKQRGMAATPAGSSDRLRKRP